MDEAVRSYDDDDRLVKRCDKPSVKHVVLLKHNKTGKPKRPDSPALQQTPVPRPRATDRKEDKSGQPDIDRTPHERRQNSLEDAPTGSGPELDPKAELLRQISTTTTSDASSSRASSPTAHPAQRSSFMDTISAKKRGAGKLVVFDDHRAVGKGRDKDSQAVYSLPQPQCYSDDTLKAVKLITEKYDSVKRRQMRAVSFRPEATLERCPEDHRDSSRPPTDNADQATYHANNSAEAPTTNESRCLSRTGDELAQRLELFHRCYESETFACSCRAKLFLAGSGSYPTDELLQEGVPLWLLDTGAGRRVRELKLVMCDPDTLLQVWSDRINYLSKYDECSCDATTTNNNDNVSRHSFHSSRSLARVFRLDFDDRTAAVDFLDQYREITRDPDDALWTVSDNTRLRASMSLREAKTKNRVKLKKSMVSTPCGFAHFVHVDAERYNSLGCVQLRNTN